MDYPLQTAVCNTRMITVAVHAADALTNDGLAHCLARCPRLSQVDLDASREPEVFVVGVPDADATLDGILRKLSPGGTGKFVIVADRWRHTNVSMIVELGVRAVLFRSRVSSGELAKAVISVAEGEGVLPSLLQGSLMQEVQQMHDDVLVPNGLTRSGFTPREVDVLKLLAEGMDLEEIASKLCYSERTIKNILYGAMKRHQLRNRAHAVSHAIRNGLI